MADMKHINWKIGKDKKYAVMRNGVLLSAREEILDGDIIITDKPTFRAVSGRDRNGNVYAGEDVAGATMRCLEVVNAAGGETRPYPADRISQNPDLYLGRIRGSVVRRT